MQTCIYAGDISPKDSHLNITRIYGGPGCGKTSYLLDILNDLIQKGTSPSRIAFVSFTNKGADAGINRARSKYHASKEDTPYWGTIHAMANRAISHKGRVIGPEDYKSFSWSTRMKFLGFFTEELSHGDDVYLFMEQLRRINEEKHDRMADLIPDLSKYEWVVRQYKKFKEIYGVFDFTDMLEYYVDSGKPLDIDYAIIDEAQDLSPIQWKCIDIMTAKCKQVFIAGDDDQAIYEWCGGNVDMFNNLSTSMDVVLDESYRVCRAALSSSLKIISGVKKRKIKVIKPNSAYEGEVIFYNNIDNVPIDMSSTYYMLSRNTFYLRKIRDKLMRLGLPFNLRGWANPRELKGKNKTKISGREVDYIRRMKDKGYSGKHGNKRIVVDTIHRVKGGEADEVVLLLDCTRAVQENMLKNLDEELRILYVAMTRCRNKLHVVYSSSSTSYDNIMARSSAA